MRRAPHTPFSSHSLQFLNNLWPLFGKAPPPFLCSFILAMCFQLCSSETLLIQYSTTWYVLPVSGNPGKEGVILFYLNQPTLYPPFLLHCLFKKLSACNLTMHAGLEREAKLNGGCPAAVHSLVWVFHSTPVISVFIEKKKKKRSYYIFLDTRYF